MNHLVHKLYAPRIHEARVRFASKAGAAIVEPSMTADELVMFLVHFSSVGVRMTEPVESWIRRAGERCEECGFAALGRALKIHARFEANHHLMMIEDTKRLVSRWNQSHGPKLDAETFLGASAPRAVEAYVRLHEDVIASSEPYCQVAIEYEIEGLSVSFGPELISHAKRVAGPDILAGLSFIEEHVAVDAGHTLFNEHELEKLLAADAGHLDALCRAGAAALDAYGAFVSECLTRAKADSRKFGEPGLSALAD